MTGAGVLGIVGNATGTGIDTDTGTANVFDAVLEQFLADLVAAVPRVLAGALFLALAYLVIRTVLAVVRRTLRRVYPADQRLIADLATAVLAVFLWFGAGLALLDVLGLGAIAASLGSAVGFIGLGVAYALKEMIADTVAGVYLLQDHDFNVGDAVETASVTGTVVSIDLRKTRLRMDDGELVVLANRDVEKKWRTIGDGDADVPAQDGNGDGS